MPRKLAFLPGYEPKTPALFAYPNGKLGDDFEAAHRAMVENIRRGDTVVTSGGLIGKVTRVKEGEGEIEVELNENNRVRVIRSTIAEVRTKGEPAKNA